MIRHRWAPQNIPVSISVKVFVTLDPSQLWCEIPKLQEFYRKLVMLYNNIEHQIWIAQRADPLHWKLMADGCSIWSRLHSQGASLWWFLGFVAHMLTSVLNCFFVHHCERIRWLNLLLWHIHTNGCVKFCSSWAWYNGPCLFATI